MCLRFTSNVRSVWYFSVYITKALKLLEVWNNLLWEIRLKHLNSYVWHYTEDVFIYLCIHSIHPSIIHSFIR